MQDFKYIAGVIVAMSAITLALRSFPFLFSRWLKDQALVAYLGKVLPPAIMVLLVIYCLKDVAWRGPQHGMVEMTAVAVTAFVHLYWRKVFLSLVAGTATYMITLQILF